MEKEFVTYEIALELKQLGFDEPCFATWSGFDENNFSVTDTVRLFSSKFSIDGTQSNTLYINPTDNRVSAPLWQQAFRWFREKYNLWNMIYPRDGWNYTIQEIDNIPSVFGDSYHKTEMRTYEEAELECLKKLIEIVKNGKK